MTANEAIERLEQHKEWGFRCVNEAIDIAIQALEEIQQYRSIGTVEEFKALKEKAEPKKPEQKYIKYGRHKWRRNKNGEIDDWAWDYEFCNGVVCERCGTTECVHCNPNFDNLEDCETKDWYCPTCGEEVKYKHHHCNCGQKLDWT